LGHIYFDGGLVSLLGFTRVKWSGCAHEAAWDGISRVVSVVHRCLLKMALCLEKKISQKILLFAVWMDSDWWGGINTFFIPIVNFLLSLSFFPFYFLCEARVAASRQIDESLFLLLLVFIFLK
jgi:hypothetical protein